MPSARASTVPLQHGELLKALRAYPSRLFYCQLVPYCSTSSSSSNRLIFAFCVLRLGARNPISSYPKNQTSPLATFPAYEPVELRRSVAGVADIPIRFDSLASSTLQFPDMAYELHTHPRYQINPRRTAHSRHRRWSYSNGTTTRNSPHRTRKSSSIHLSVSGS